MKAKHILAVVAVVLALLLAYSYYWGNSQKKEKLGLIDKTEQMSSEIDDLNELKESLQFEVDSLELAYQELNFINDSLATSLSDAKKTIYRRNQTIKAVKASNTASESEIGNLSAQIQSLLNTKSQLQDQIQSLQMENDSLKMRAGVLEADLGKAREDNLALANLNRSMQDDISKLTLANFKASGFRAEVERKKPKVTAKGKKAKRIKVSFDLTAVPEEYQGVRPIYMVVSDDKGTPIKMTNPIMAKISLNGMPTDIIAAESKEVNITSSQRLTFTHELSERLSAGYYRIMVYTDIGLLGASSIRMR